MKARGTREGGEKTKFTKFKLCGIDREQLGDPRCG